MQLNLAGILLIVAAAQGLLLALLIFQKHRALFANRYLALLMLSYTCVLVHLVLQDTGLYASAPLLFLISGLSIASMPLHYLYTRHLIRRSERFEPKELAHFVLFGLYEILLLISIVNGTLDLTRAGEVNATETPLILRLYNLAVIGLGLYYLGTSLRLINRYERRVKDVVSALEPVQLTWLRNITLTGIAAVSLFTLEELLLIAGLNFSNFLLSSVCFGLYVYGMGYLGLLKSEIFADRAVEKSIIIAETMESEQTSAKYERSGLSDAAAEQHLRSLLAAMETEHLYRNSALTLTELADHLAVSPHNLSEVINTRLRKNFYDLVNGYRLEEVKRDLADPAKQHLKIISLAFDAGFNSKATFNTLFKEQTGMTPSEYKKQILTDTP